MEWLVALLVVSLILHAVLLAMVVPVGRVWSIARDELRAYARLDRASRTDEGR